MSDGLYFLNRYRIPSGRLQNWDYSRPGYYFITICTKNRICWFGNIKNRQNELSSLGKIVEKFWLEIPGHFSNILIDEYIIMPNHLHGILQLLNDNNCRDAINRVSTTGGITGEHNCMLHVSISKCIRWFKGRCSYEIKNICEDFRWQSRFYDHIIRNERALFAIRKYIRQNLQNWDNDKENPKIWEKYLEKFK